MSMNTFQVRTVRNLCAVKARDVVIDEKGFDWQQAAGA
jgi:hypothetical protein